jgi:hypothetical protein
MHANSSTSQRKNLPGQFLANFHSHTFHRWTGQILLRFSERNAVGTNLACSSHHGHVPAAFVRRLRVDGSRSICGIEVTPAEVEEAVLARSDVNWQLTLHEAHR